MLKQFSTVRNMPRDSKGYREERREEEEGDRGDQVEKGGESKGERAIKPVITPLSENGY